MTLYLIFLLIVTVSRVAKGAVVVSQNRTLAVVNSTFFVSCIDTSNLSVSWIGPKGSLGHQTRPVAQTGSNGTRILFTDTKLDDTADYICRNSKGEDALFRLTVEAPLEFMDTPTEQKATEGSDVTVRCEVRSGRRTWSYEDYTAIQDPRIQIIGDGLLIRNATRKDSKVYICKAVQPNTGTIKDRRIKLTVEHPPSFKYPHLKEENVYGYLNGNINLTCIVEAEPTAKFEWLSSLTKVRKTGNVTESPNESTLQLKLEKSTFGKYKCRATNKLGRVERIIVLGEGVKPDPPQFLELRGYNSDLLDLGIKGPDMKKLNVSESMKPIKYRVRYRIHKKIGSDWDQREFNVSEENSYIIQGLQHSTEYEVAAATINVAGSSEYTNISVFKTIAAVSDDATQLASLITTTFVCIQLLIGLLISKEL